MRRVITTRDHLLFFVLAAAIAFVLLPARDARGTPQFARMYGIESCTSCHVVAPKLNRFGEAFRARGYRLDPTSARGPQSTAPLAVWITARQEEQVSRDFSELYLNRVELISGGPIGDLPLSYFVEWRVVSMETRSDGTLRDRSGRFEDAFINLGLGQRAGVTVGQFRALNQIDVSRRLSLGEPAAFSTSLAGDPSDDAGIQSLRGFSPSGRSPGVALSLQSIEGESPSDGLFHRATLPFVGEFSIPLTEEARDEASFELEGPAKGIFLETYYRQGLNSIGAHGFVDDDRWLLMGVGTVNYKDLYLTAGVGIDDQEDASSRGRYSLEVEYLPDWSRRWRPGVGFRVEQVTTPTASRPTSTTSCSAGRTRTTTRPCSRSSTGRRRTTTRSSSTSPSCFSRHRGAAATPPG